jgi:hypothetical protein
MRPVEMHQPATASPRKGFGYTEAITLANMLGGKGNHITTVGLRPPFVTQHLRTLIPMVAPQVLEFRRVLAGSLIRALPSGITWLPPARVGTGVVSAPRDGSQISVSPDRLLGDDIDDPL